jgi:hypothetical protein
MPTTTTPTLLGTPPTALDTLEQIGRAPGEAADRAGEAVRESLATYQARGAACLARLRVLEAQHGPELRRLAALDFRVFHATLGGRSALPEALRSAVESLRVLFDGAAHPEGGQTLSGIAWLEALPGRIKRLTARDAHACPERCGCPLGLIRACVENCEIFPTLIPEQMTRITARAAELRDALAGRPGVEMITLAGVPPPDPRPITRAEIED